MNTKLIILGCGNSMGVPRIDSFWGRCNKRNKKNIRTRCSAAIIKGSNSILIDTSPDIRNQLVTNNIKKLSSVIFTHQHVDQTNGLFELRPFTFNKRDVSSSTYWKNKKRINIYGNQRTINYLKRKFDFCFKKTSAYPPIVKANIIKKKFTLGRSNEKIHFKTVQVKHGLVKSVAYIFEKTAYISDCNDLSIIKIKELKNLNYLIIDCLRYRKNFTHFNLKESLYVHSMLKPKKTILTNLHCDFDYDYLLRSLPKNVLPAYDGLKLNL